MLVATSLVLLAVGSTYVTASGGSDEQDTATTQERNAEWSWWEEPSVRGLSSAQPGEEEPPCEQETWIDCASSDGTDCSALTIPQASCGAGGPVSSIVFHLHDAVCYASSHSQGDSAECDQLQTLDTVPGLTVFCFNDNFDALQVSPPMAQLGDAIRVDSAPSSLSSEINCIVSDPVKGLVQNIKIDTSGTVDLKLNDKFGMLAVKACGDLNCFDQLTYTFIVENKGVDSEFDSSTVTFQDSSADDLRDDPGGHVGTILEQDEVESYSISKPVDLCASPNLVSIFQVHATAASTGLTCSDVSVSSLSARIP